MRAIAISSLFIIGFLFSLTTSAQLEFIPPLSAAFKDTQRLDGAILLTTRDVHSQFGAPPIYPSSLQIVDALEPWPPIFFANISPMQSAGSVLFQDISFQKAVKQLTYYRGVTNRASVSGAGMYYICDTNFALIDSFAGSNGSIENHGFEINAQGERLYLTNIAVTLDISKFTGIARDTAVTVNVQKIEIMNAHDSVVFSWNPLEHIALDETQQAYYDLQVNNPFDRGWDWSHSNSVAFTHDGNIVYSYRFIGVGKVNRKTGELMWKLGGKKPTISVPPGGEYYLQHDFREVSPGIYSLFSNGNDEYSSRAIEYHIDEKNMMATVVRIYEPAVPIFSMGTGNYEAAENGLRLVNYGRYASLEERQKIIEIIDENDLLIAEYFSPSLNFVYQAHLVPGWYPKRPEVIDVNGILRLAGQQDYVSWYELNGNVLTYLSDGDSLMPSKGKNYLATKRTEAGWLVSKPYLY